MGKKTLLLICTILLSIVLARVGTANAEPAILSVIPDFIVVEEPGREFNVTITITNAPLMTQWIIRNVTWNPDVIELVHAPPSKVDIQQGDFLSSAGSTVFLIKTPELGRLPEITCATLGLETNSGDGTLVTIKFKAKAMGESDINIEYGVLLNGITTVDTPDRQKSHITVVPEFPAFMLLPLFLTATSIALIAATVWSRKRRSYISVS